jgi:lipid-binding SYLF domain-containing protein
VLDEAEGLAVFPSVIKGGLLIGGHRGKGILSVRARGGRTWSAPAFLTLTGGSIGAQIGGQAIDLVLVIMNPRGIERLVANQVKVGVDASVAAGPVGRDAEASTDIQMRAEILSYSRARGLFAGVTIKGSTVRADRDANTVIYGRPYTTREIVFDRLGGAPAAIGPWRAALGRYVR